MSSLNQDIKGAKTTINNNLRLIQFEKYSKIYPFTNEDLFEAFNDFDFNNKRCLTVLGSSDQALDMCLSGANEITTFDINKLTKYYLYLKKAALLSNLTKEEYLDFFYPYGSSYDSYQDSDYYDAIFSKIATNLSSDNLTFWTSLFDSYPSTVINKNLFYNDANSKKKLQFNIKYLYGNNYYKLKEKIKDIKLSFINTDITELPERISEKYDFIYLSNIMEYSEHIYNMSKFNSIKEYKNLILKLIDNLNINGTIIISYFFYTLSFYGLAHEIYTEKDFDFKIIGNCLDEAILQYTKTTTLK